jgi:hypothetical protein
MAAFRAKRHRRIRNRNLTMYGGGLAAVAIVAVVAVLQPWATAPQPGGTAQLPDRQRHRRQTAARRSPYGKHWPWHGKAARRLSSRTVR